MGAPLLSTLGKTSAATTKEATLATSDRGSATTKAARYAKSESVKAQTRLRALGAAM